MTPHEKAKVVYLKVTYNPERGTEIIAEAIHAAERDTLERAVRWHQKRARDLMKEVNLLKVTDRSAVVLSEAHRYYAVEIRKLGDEG